MPDESAPRSHMASPEETMAAVDFDAFYQGKQAVAGLDMAFETPPWVIGGPQPVLVDLESTGVLGDGHLLDAGCGTGDNALFLASRGHRVTGFDASPAALDQARKNAQERGLDVEFTEADATRLDELPAEAFDAVVDSGLYHVLGPAQRSAYARALSRVVRPGALLHMLATAEAEGPKTPLPPPVSPDDLRTHLGPYWDVERIRLTRFTTSFTEESLTRMRPAIHAASGVDLDPAAMEYDGRGRLTSPCWYVRAARRS
ncbi:class I SAM-dependent methyltransferase [Streptomyces sp. NPDC048172]|uniref:class I SAM-dependent methyltransferase n=1 Tax=Streptomyces sp. NPDC048172 TaxID=3365505 RepID=UPI00371EAB3E